MYELGYFECLKGHKNVILILDNTISKFFPSMLRGHYITRYEGYTDYEVVIDRIEGILKE